MEIARKFINIKQVCEGLQQKMNKSILLLSASDFSTNNLEICVESCSAKINYLRDSQCKDLLHDLQKNEMLTRKRTKGT